MQLTGAQLTIVILVAAGLVVAGALLHDQTVITVGSSAITGALALASPRRDPTTRSRAGDRRPTVPGAGGE